MTLIGKYEIIVHIPLCTFLYRTELTTSRARILENNGIVVEEKFVSYLESIARLISKHLPSTPTFTKVSPHQI